MITNATAVAPSVADAVQPSDAAPIGAPAARELWEAYWLPAQGGVTLADLQRRAEPWAAAGYTTHLEWLTNGEGALVGVAISARPGATAQDAQLEAYREAMGADIAGALAEWEPC